MGMIKHSKSTQSNKFAISLQYLKKKLRMEFIFCMHGDKHQSFCKLSLQVLMEVSKVPKIGNWQYFCDILKSGSHHPNKICSVCFNESPLNVIKNTLFHLESYFRSQDILIFVLTFCRVQRNLENLEKIAFFEKLRESLENSEKI